MDLGLLAVMNGSINKGLDNATTLEAFVIVLGVIGTYAQCADIVEQLLQVVLNLVPMIPSDEDGCTMAEIYFSFLLVRLVTLCKTAKFQEFANAETEAMAWADSHRHEMSPSFYFSRKVKVITLSMIVVRHDNAARLPSLRLLLNELEAELGRDSGSAWLIRLMIATCFQILGNYSEATNTLQDNIHGCETSESDSRHALTSANIILTQVLMREQAYDELVKLKQSLVRRRIKDLGPYHEDTLIAKNDILYYESILVRDANKGKYPLTLNAQAWYARKEGGLGLDESAVLSLENVMACKALKRHDEVPLLWQGVTS